MSEKEEKKLKKSIQDLIETLPPIKKLKILESLSDVYREESRAEIENDLLQWKAKKGIPRIKTDY